MSRSISKRLEAQFKKILRDNNPYSTCVMDLDDIRIWYVLVSNLPDPYKQGEYIFKLIISDDFPDNPPSLIALTPNGLMEMGGKVCVSVGEFHKDDYSKSNKEGQYGWVPSLGIGGFILQGVVNALISFDDSDLGIRLNNQSNIVKKKTALESVIFNKQNNSEILELFQVHKECFPNLKIWISS